MRALMFGKSNEQLVAATLYCCECNLCSLFSCPEDLDPKNVCVQGKPAAREQGLKFKGDPNDIEVHPMKDYRRISTKRLILKLGLDNYRNVGPLTKHEFHPKKVVLPLKQHTGAPAVAQVKVGDRVKAGDLIAKPAENALGARIHSSIDGASDRREQLRDHHGIGRNQWKNSIQSDWWSFRASPAATRWKTP